MNRKLHNTILAFSVSSVMLFVGLVVAEPASLRQEASPTSVPVSAFHGQAHDDAVDAAIDARVRAFETELARAEDPGEVLALTAGLIATTATEAALLAALGELREDGAERGRAERPDNERTRPARRSGGSREVIAVPYFSFARGSRGSRS